MSTLQEAGKINTPNQASEQRSAKLNNLETGHVIDQERVKKLTALLDKNPRDYTKEDGRLVQSILNQAAEIHGDELLRAGVEDGSFAGKSHMANLRTVKNNQDLATTPKDNLQAMKDSGFLSNSIVAITRFQQIHSDTSVAGNHITSVDGIVGKEVIRTMLEKYTKTVAPAASQMLADTPPANQSETIAPREPLNAKQTLSAEKVESVENPTAQTKTFNINGFKIDPSTDNPQRIAQFVSVALKKEVATFDSGTYDLNNSVRTAESLENLIEHISESNPTLFDEVKTSYGIINSGDDTLLKAHGLDLYNKIAAVQNGENLTAGLAPSRAIIQQSEEKTTDPALNGVSKPSVEEQVIATTRAGVMPSALDLVKKVVPGNSQANSSSSQSNDALDFVESDLTDGRKAGAAFSLAYSSGNTTKDPERIREIVQTIASNGELEKFTKSFNQWNAQQGDGQQLENVLANAEIRLADFQQEKMAAMNETTPDTVEITASSNPTNNGKLSPNVDSIPTAIVESTNPYIVSAEALVEQDTTLQRQNYVVNRAGNAVDPQNSPDHKIAEALVYAFESSKKGGIDQQEQIINTLSALDPETRADVRRLFNRTYPKVNARQVIKMTQIARSRYGKEFQQEVNDTLNAR